MKQNETKKTKKKEEKDQANEHTLNLRCKLPELCGLSLLSFRKC